MRRWPIILLCLVLFAGAMLGVRAVLVATIPGVNAWLSGAFGEVGSLLVIIGFFGLCGIYGFWPRDAQGRTKPLSRR